MAMAEGGASTVKEVVQRTRKRADVFVPARKNNSDEIKTKREREKKKCGKAMTVLRKGAPLCCNCFSTRALLFEPIRRLPRVYVARLATGPVVSVQATAKRQ